MKLYICGNGFDLHHGLKTSYGDYRRYLENTHPDSITAFEDIVGISGDCMVDWKDIEKSLKVNYSKILRRFADLETTYRNFDECNDPGALQVSNSLTDAFRGLTDFITNFTGKYLLEWLRTIDASNAKADLRLPEDSLFVTFNYTDILETVYGIDQRNILHVHGRLSALDGIEARVNDIKEDVISTLAQDFGEEEAQAYWSYEEEPNWYSSFVRDELQFGAVIKRELEQDRLKRQYAGDDEFNNYLQDPIRVICEFMDRSTKKPEDNFSALERFLASKTFETVVLMGHSLSSFDQQYYDAVFLPMLKDAEWVYMLHGDDETTFYDFANRLGLSERQCSIRKW